VADLPGCRYIAAPAGFAWWQPANEKSAFFPMSRLTARDATTAVVGGKKLITFFAQLGRSPAAPPTPSQWRCLQRSKMLFTQGGLFPRYYV